MVWAHLSRLSAPFSLEGPSLHIDDGAHECHCSLSDPCACHYTGHYKGIHTGEVQPQALGGLLYNQGSSQLQHTPPLAQGLLQSCCCQLLINRRASEASQAVLLGPRGCGRSRISSQSSLGEGRGIALASERMFSASQALLRKHCRCPGNLWSQSHPAPAQNWGGRQHKGGELPVTEGAQDETEVLR